MGQKMTCRGTHRHGRQTSGQLSSTGGHSCTCLASWWPCTMTFHPENSLHVQALCEGALAVQPIPSLIYMLLLCSA